MFRMAYNDYELAVSIFRIPRNDEAFLNPVAYHLQQSVEKLLKAFLECTGVTVPNTHDIDKLVRMSRDNGSRVFITDWLEDKADTLTRWETDTRYNIEYHVELRKIQDGIAGIEELFRVNGLKTELREELENDEKKKILKSFFPKDYEPADEFEWNCYYQIYRKKIEETINKRSKRIQ